MINYRFIIVVVRVLNRVQSEISIAQALSES